MHHTEITPAFICSRPKRKYTWFHRLVPLHMFDTRLHTSGLGEKNDLSVSRSNDCPVFKEGPNEAGIDRCVIPHAQGVVERERWG
jgi:hypothetical protein